MTSKPRRFLTAIAAVFTAFTLTFAVAACGGDDDGADSGSSSDSESSSS
jgi:hypothetical protein